MSEMLNDLVAWFSFDAQAPLNFTEIGFWGFFAAVLLGLSMVKKRIAMRNIYLFVISLFFYYKISHMFFLLLVFSTVSDYLIGWALFKSTTDWKRRSWVALSVVVNLSVLFYFKYSYFIAEFLYDAFQLTWDPEPYLALFSNEHLGTDFVEDRIILPVGISFYTFQCLSYIIDIYRRQIEPVRRIADFGFFVSFFPQLVAGPIVRASEFVPQLYKNVTVNRVTFGMGLFWILNGLLKKMVLADYVASNFADRVFAQPTLYSGLECILALFAYSLQVYADFSGYTDVAIGVAMIMGFTLTKNFNSPYKATSVSDYWRRWHISLSSWLRDYLYIPLGGNREGSIATYVLIFGAALVLSIMAETWWVPMSLGLGLIMFYLLARWVPAFRNWLNTNINIMLTMLLGGWWHGASWNFVTWGGLNGIGIVVYKLWKRIRPYNPYTNRVARVWTIFITLTFITFTRAWFRAPGWEEAITILERSYTAFDASLTLEILQGFWKPFLVMLIGYLIHWIPENVKVRYRSGFAKAPVLVQWAIAFGVMLLVYQSLTADSQPFIYFQF